ncbi:MAG: hypothetical protein JST68_12180 [Bacteroidetes bacterium]|nr:hypothetical protein [Bacteroidota bacterium]
MKPYVLICILSGLTALYPRPEFTANHNRFAFKFFTTLLEQDTARNNKIIAPFSLYAGLGMLSNGAAKATRDSISATLGELEIPNLNSYCKEALQQMPLADPSIHMQIANTIWFNQRKMTLSPTYESISGNFYYTQAQPLNFGARDASTQVNQWFDQNTMHMFPSVIDHSDLTESMYLLNAFCFKGSWKTPFRTNSHSYFYLTPTVPKVVKYMSTIAVFPVFSDTAFTMVELPCGDKNAYSLYILLPENENHGVKSLLASLTPASLDNALSKLTPQNINLFMPGWESTYSIEDLRPSLSRLGMSLAFNTSGEADFTNMYSTGAKKASISQTRHLTCIRVNENGIETDPAAVELPAPISDIYSRRLPRTITFDHPFLYLLMDKQHDLVLQMGIVDDPKLEAVKPISPVPPKRPVIRLPRRRKR